MKGIIGFIAASLLLLTILAGCLYLKEERPDLYDRIFGTSQAASEGASEATPETDSPTGGTASWEREPAEDTEQDTEQDTQQDIEQSTQQDIAQNTQRSAQGLSAASGRFADVPITESTKGEIPETELRDLQRSDLVPMEGTGQEIADGSSVSDETGPLGEEYTFSEQMYPYRAMLGEEGKKAYNQIYANALACNRQPIAMQASLAPAEMTEVMSAVYNDHPELFWLETAYRYLYKRNQNVHSVILSYNGTADDLAASQTTFNEAVSQVVSQAASAGNEVEKERFVHDYLIQNVTYDENVPMHQSAYSALCSGRSVCAGYSRAFQHILMQMGIPAYYCTGIADGGPHAWNIVQLGDHYYNVDSLWDDSISEKYGINCYLYFNLPDVEFNTEHSRSGLAIKLPTCDASDMKYETVFRS